MLALLTACRAAPTAEEQVDAARYDAFWLWAGLRPQPVLDTAREVYILDAEVIAAGGAVRFVDLRPALPRVSDTALWLVLRLDTLDWQDAHYAMLETRIARWQKAGLNLRGVQIDFDARTRGLNGYAAFLKGVRKRLPAKLKLSITGLMDWSANGEPEALAALGDVVDEIVIQTYQGRRTIPGYKRYLARLSRLEMPYKIGLVQHGRWREPADIRRDPDFRGYVVFLLNSD